MVSKEILAAVKEETSRLLFTNGFPWNELRDKVAAELAPLFADLVQQAVVGSLTASRPDHRVEKLRHAIDALNDFNTTGPENRESWPWHLSDMLEEFHAVRDLFPDQLPPRVVFGSALLDAEPTLIEALSEARYALDQAFQRGPGWEELARAVSGRIGSELEVRNRG